MISIIVPTLNEENNLKKLFKGIDSALKRNYELIIVDSNSKDKTFAVAKQLSKKYPIRAYNTGKLDLSNSVLFGISKARGNLIVVMDADLQHPPQMLPRMTRALKNADIVIASRFVKGAKAPLGLRTIVSKAFIFLSHLCCPKTHNIRDTSTGFFAFRKKVIEKADLKPLGFKILLEILAKGYYSKIIEIPFHFKKRKGDRSKFNIKQIKLSFKHLWWLAKYNREHYRIGKFCAVGASGVAVNMGLLWFLSSIAKIYFLISGAIAIELSILTNFVLNDIWTFRKERKGNYFFRLGKFNFTRLIALGINFAALWFFRWLGLHYLVSNLIGIVLATLITYFSSLWWVWK